MKEEYLRTIQEKETILRDFYENIVCQQIVCNLEAIGKFLETYNLPRLNQGRNRKSEQTNYQQ